MPTISTNQARATFTSMCVDVYKDYVPAYGFLRSFFPTKQEFTKYVSIQVQRGLELVAADVARKDTGNYNKFAKSTERVFEPPYYREYIELTDIELYDRLFGSTSIDDSVLKGLMQTVQYRMKVLHDKIERAKEINCATALLTGVVTSVNSDTITFARDAASLVAYNSGTNNWADNTIDPFANMGAMAEFLRTKGKSIDTTFNLLMGKSAFNALYNNSIFKSKVTQILYNNINVINPPQRNATGAAFHGQLSVGSWKVNLWTYPQFYDDFSTGSRVYKPYLDDKKVVMIPENPHFVMASAAVPQIVTGFNATTGIPELPPVVASEYVVGQYIDQRNSSHVLDVKSAALPILTAIDQVITMQVLS